MFKIKYSMVALLASLMVTASAQESAPMVGYSTQSGCKTNFKKNNASDNWFISIAGGVSLLDGDENSNADFGDRLNFAPQLSLGKWFSPYLGTRLQLNGGALNGFEGRNAEYKEDHDYIAAHVDLMWDVTNYFGKYDANRLFRAIPWVGIGYAQRFKTDGDVPHQRTESPSFNAGILTAFRLNSNFDLNVEFQASLLNEDFNRVAMNHLTDCVMQLSAGITYKIGGKDFEVLEPTDYNLLNSLNSQINDLRAENEELSKRPESCPECNETVTQVVNNYVDNIVFFRINSARIDKSQQINIFNTSEFVKKNNAPIKVIGYADRKTGKESYNMKLSEKRARAVAKELINSYGVSSDQITIEYRGSDEQPYEENNWNRVVIMRANK